MIIKILLGGCHGWLQMIVAVRRDYESVPIPVVTNIDCDQNTDFDYHVTQRVTLADPAGRQNSTLFVKAVRFTPV